MSATDNPPGESPPGSEGAPGLDAGPPAAPETTTPADPPTEGSDAAEHRSRVPAHADEAAPLDPAEDIPPGEAPSSPADPDPAEDEGDEGATLSLLTEQRIAEVIDLMHAGSFRRGKTVRELAGRWEVSTDRARRITALASHRVRATMTDPDELAAEVVPRLLEAFHDAVDEGDARGVAALGAQLLEVGGLKTSKTEVTGKDGGPIEVEAFDPTQYSDDELEALARGEQPKRKPPPRKG
jgi:hypothetical protein